MTTIEDSHADTWKLWKRPIFIDTRLWKCTSDHTIFIGYDHDLHRMVVTHRDFITSRGRHVDTSGCISMQWSSSDGGSVSKGDRGPQSTSMTAAWSRTDRYVIVVQSQRNQGHDRFKLMAHDRRAIVAIKSSSPSDPTAQILWAKLPFKNRCILSSFLNSWLIREVIKQIWSKILSSSWFRCV